jgi:flagellar M-ring protein FliF
MAQQISGQLASFFERLSLKQKLVLAGATIAAVAAIIAMVTVVNRPAYGTLFNNLAPEDASKIVDKLKEKSVPYTLEDGGKTVLVPKQQVYELRLSLASEGIPHSSVIGYEIFDRTNLGVSDFVQKINYRRALEGELARTILQLEEVEGARVHIVVPEKSLFKEDEKATTASVVLKLKSGKPLKREMISGIGHLVASSVEGLEVNNVAILDSRGVLLSDNAQSNSLSALSSTQYELQQKVESYITKKAQSILEGAVGTGNALVQVTAELDFRQVERNLEKYDPENTAIRSEQTTEEKTPTSDSSDPSSRLNSITNYEVNKTVEHIVEGVGTIKRISVAAMINGTMRTVESNGEKKTEYVPRKQEEMGQLTEIVKRAVGFDVQRNDEVSVVNLPFGNGLPQEDMVYKNAPFADYNDIAQKGFLVVAMLAALLILRRLLGRMRVHVGSFGHGAMGMGGGGRLLEVGDVEDHLQLSEGGKRALRPRRQSLVLPSAEDEISEEAFLRSEKRKRITQYVQEKPDDASRLLKVWLAEEP